MFTPEFWVLLSFICFIVCFGRKLYKAVIEYIDLYINNVKVKVDEAEKLRDEATELLKQACIKRDSITTEINAMNEASMQKLEKLDEANRNYIDNLAINFQKSFDRKVEATVAQKIESVKRQVIEQVVSDLEKKIVAEKPKIRVSRNDLEHL